MKMANGEGQVLVASIDGKEIDFGAKEVESDPVAQQKGNSRMSTLLFWQGKSKAQQPSRNWIHPPDSLTKGHIAYLVKFLGTTTVDQPKGIEVVKEAIRRLQFNQQLKKSENKENAKCKKVEITISVDGVAIQEPRTNNILHQFPLHRISYCADDKGAKKYFSFIAKGQAGGQENGRAEQHECFVFVSTKLASEITLTIGQAFDLAYRRFLTDNGKYIELQKLTLQNKRLELQLEAYRNRLLELSRVTYKSDVDAFLLSHQLQHITEFKVPAELEQQLSQLSLTNGFAQMNGSKTPDHVPGSDGTASITSSDSTSNGPNLLLNTPPQTHNSSNVSSKNPVVGTRLEGLLLDSDSDSDFDPRASESEPPRQMAPAVTSPTPLLAPPPKASKRHNHQQQQQQQPQQRPSVNGYATTNGMSHANGNDPFGAQPFAPTQPLAQPNQKPTPNYDIDFNLTTSVFNSSSNSFTNGLAGYDPFETKANNGNIFGNGTGFNGYNGSFGGLSEKQTVALDSNFNGFLDKTISDMKDGFSRGITFGNDDFNLDALDPLKKN